jgi:hypothetical protein
MLFPDELSGLPCDATEIGIETPCPEETPETRSGTATLRNEIPETSSIGKPIKPAIPADLKAVGEAVMSAAGEILNRAGTAGERYFSEDEKAGAR